MASWVPFLFSALLSIIYLPVGPLQASFWVLLMCSHHSLSISLLSGTTRCSRVILCFPCHSPGISHFSNKLSRSVEDVI